MLISFIGMKISNLSKVNKRLLRVVFVLILAALSVSIYNASIVHFYYRVTTGKGDRGENTARYHYLALEELKLTGSDRVLIRKERKKLYYWFHARGWDIDEDEESQSRPWDDLRIYWEGSRE